MPAVYASFGTRFLELIVDSVITVVAGGIAVGALGVAIGFASAANGESTVDIKSSVDAYNPLFVAAGVVTNWLYYSLMESSPYQATLGKKWFQLRVTDVAGNRISFGRASTRFWSKYISAVILGIGYIMAAFDDRHQALHDKIASTLVVRAR
jgi:uncharacterized RDD family membrane protein YckC